MATIHNEIEPGQYAASGANLVSYGVEQERERIRRYIELEFVVLYVGGTKHTHTYTLGFKSRNLGRIAGRTQQQQQQSRDKLMTSRTHK